MRFLPLIVLFLFIVSLLFFAFTSSQNQTDKDVIGRMVPGIGGGPSTEDEMVPISQNPGLYIGKHITIEGQIERVLGNGVFVIKQNGYPESDVLYIIPATPPQQYPQITYRTGQNVSVTGSVKVLNNYEIEVETGRTITDENENLMVPKAVILANDIMLSNITPSPDQNL